MSAKANLKPDPQPAILVIYSWMGVLKEEDWANLARHAFPELKDVPDTAITTIIPQKKLSDYVMPYGALLMPRDMPTSLFLAAREASVTVGLYSWPDKLPRNAPPPVNEWTVEVFK